MTTNEERTCSIFESYKENEYYYDNTPRWTTTPLDRAEMIGLPFLKSSDKKLDNLRLISFSYSPAKNRYSWVGKAVQHTYFGNEFEYSTTTKVIVFPDRSWKNVREGICICKEIAVIKDNLLSASGRNVTLEMPTYEVLAKAIAANISSKLLSVNADTDVTYYDNKYGVYAICNGTVFAEIEGSFVEFSSCVIKDIYENPIGKENAFDIICNQCIGMTHAELLDSYKIIGYRNVIGDILGMTIGYTRDLVKVCKDVLGTYGMVICYDSKKLPNMNYVSIDDTQLVKALPYLDVEKLLDILEYLQEYNMGFEAQIKSKIKKGQLQVK